MNVLVIGGGAREHAICSGVARSGHSLFVVMKNANPGIKRLADGVLLEKETNVEAVVDYASGQDIDLAIVGPEAPEDAGVTNALKKADTAVASPTKEAAEIETDKEYMRGLMDRYDIPGSLEARAFSDVGEAKEFIERHGGVVAVKPVGLTGGKGVKVAGDHLHSVDEAVDYAARVIDEKIGDAPRVLIEERAVGEEFTVQAFCDGATILPTPAVQDHKRLLPNDDGPNTGGMGSYSHASGMLPFMDGSDYEEAVGILQHIVDALRREGRPYHGVIYGQFMLTRDGPRVIEINARWGDPEAMNIIPLIESDFVELNMAMVEGSLGGRQLDMRQASTVCKYVVPEGYGRQPNGGHRIGVNEEKIADMGGILFYASVDERDGGIYTTTSRSLAVLGVADEIAEAETICEECLRHVHGNHLFIRHDIGKQALVDKRVAHMRRLRS
ncbi:MAG: phosphoribosylamine--glycine ligase [Thermoplasmatota archaeon]